jgi:hypothetical protein
MADSGGCNDGNNCTSNDYCENGACIPGEPRCTGSGQCFTEYCDGTSLTGPCPRVTYPNGTPCLGQYFCDGPAVCIGGSCTLTPPGDEPCSNDQCVGTCNEALDQCNPPDDCDDDDLCTTDWCADDACHNERKCVSDGNPCNGDEGCSSQTGCYVDPPPDCDDENACTDDSCNPSSGCQNTPNARSCDDGNACTVNDHCQGSACLGETDPDQCDDNNECTADSCIPAGPNAGCKHVPKNCNDGLPCTLDTCDPATGDCHHDCVPQAVPEGRFPEKDDRTFVYKDDVQLQSGTYPFDDDLLVTRYAGPTNGNGNLTNAAALIADELAGPYGVLTIYMQGVLPNTNHTVSFNGGTSLALKASPNCGWSNTRSYIPLAEVRFPGAPGPPGGSPAPRANTITFNIDGQPTCLRFRGASLSVKLMSPIILIHGNDSDGGFFTRQGFTGRLDEKHLVWDASIQLPTSTIEANGLALGSGIPAIAASRGVDSVHLVAHSKGGLDAREYLAVSYQSGRCKGGPNPGNECDTNAECGSGGICKRPLDVLSLTTLSTPHNGSILADVSMTYAEAAKVASGTEFMNFPAMSELLTWLFPPDEGRPSLTTGSCADFNSRNTAPLPHSTVYNTTAADADKNNSASIDSLTEISGFSAESLKFWGFSQAFPITAMYSVDRFYQILRKVTTVTVTYDTPPGWQPGYGPILATITGVENGVQYANDTFVTIRSAKGTGSFSARTSNNASFVSAAGRNHTSVADAVSCDTVVPWLVQIERSSGDLR